MGVPLINAIYEKDPLIGMYTLPLLIWHPMQLVVGSFLAPKLFKWVAKQEKKRLGLSEKEDDDRPKRETESEDQQQQEQQDGTQETEKEEGFSA